MSYDRLVRAEISKKNLLYNIDSVKKLLHPSTKYMAVVKANAYGHGIREVTQIIVDVVDFFGVVCLYEAKQLRENEIKIPILILNYTDVDSLEEAIDLDLRIAVIDTTVLEKIDAIARKKKKNVLIHIKVDTGMHRLGVDPHDAVSLIKKTRDLKYVTCEGIFTHFATSDEKDLSFTKNQLETFQALISKLSLLGILPPIIHCANSAATLRLPETHFTMVRPGKITYGLAPSSEFDLPFTPRPVLSLKTQIVQIREINTGESVGYGRAFVAKRKMKMATLPIGYGDGFRRAPQNFGKVLVRGKRAPIIGRVSMDQTTIDVSHIHDVVVDDEVVVIGTQGNMKISASDVANKIGTISYEVIAGIQQRVSRIVV